MQNLPWRRVMLRTRTLAIFSAIIFTIGTSCVWYYYKQKNQTAETMEEHYLGKRQQRPENQSKPDDITKKNQQHAEEESTWEEGINPAADQQEETIADVSENDQLEDIYFDFDESRIKGTELKKLEILAKYLLNHHEHHVLIEGHCDERGSDEYNRALGERRAIAVKFYLTELGVNKKMLSPTRS